MQSLESIISFFFFISIAAMILVAYSPQQLDDSLYRLQLAEDSWRVLYLRGAFQSPSRESLESEFRMIEEQTGLCLFLDGIETTNCRGGEQGHTIISSVTRTIIYEGEPKTHTFSIGK